MAGISGGIADIATRGFQWWTSELRGFLPGRDGVDASRKSADIAVGVDSEGLCISVRPLNGTRSTPLLTGSASQREAIEALNQLSRTRPNCKICLVLPYSACLERRVAIPRTARRQTASILALDLERSTPFKMSEVYTGYILTPCRDKKDWLTASQFVVKRKLAETAIASIEALGLKVVSLDVLTANGKSFAGVNCLDNGLENQTAAPSRRPLLLMTLLALGLTASASWIGLSRRELALVGLEHEVSLARKKAEAVSREHMAAEAAQKDIAAVRAFKSGQPSSVEVINELTRLLPDDVVLTDLEIAGDTVNFSGVAASSAAVVPVLERSTAFRDVLFSAPVKYDERTSKEHFSLKVRLRHSTRTIAAAIPQGVVQ